MKRVKKFSRKTRLFDLVKTEHHEQFRTFASSVGALTEGAPENWKNLAMLNFDFERCIALGLHEQYGVRPRFVKTAVIFKICDFLHAIAGHRGLRCSLQLFCNYLAQTEHSNLCLKSGSIKTLICRRLAYLEELENRGEKW